MADCMAVYRKQTGLSTISFDHYIYHWLQKFRAPGISTKHTKKSIALGIFCNDPAIERGKSDTPAIQG